jgi:hypothetical protein
MIHHLDGEVFFLKNVKIGIYSSFHYSNMMLEENISEKFIYGSLGPTIKINFYYTDLKVRVGYFIEQKNISYSDIPIDFSLIQGINVFSSLTFQQKIYNFLPKAELSVSGKIGLKEKFIESQEKVMITELSNYDYSVNLHLYRFDVLYNYYLSPMIGIEKSESLTRRNLINIQVGASLNNKRVRSNIAQVGALFSFYNSHKQHLINEEKTVSSCIFGFFIKFNAFGLFIHNLDF